MTEETTIVRTTTTTTEERKPNLLNNMLAVASLIIVLIVVVWGLIHLASLLSPWFSSLFTSKTSSALQVRAPESVTSGTPFTVRWSYVTSAKGTYAFLYPCKDSFHLTTPGTGGVQNTIPCGTAFAVGTTSITVTPLLSSTLAGGQATTLSEPLTVIFTPAQRGAIPVQGSAIVAIRPGATSPQPVVQTPVVPAPAESARAIPSGPSDLSVRMISATLDANGLATAVFDISNVGTGASGGYTFQAYLPTRTAYTYYSLIQVSLSPGSHIVNTLRWTQATPGVVSVVVDPSGSTSDPNRTDNYAAQNLQMSYGNYNYAPQSGYYAQPYVY